MLNEPKILALLILTYTYTIIMSSTCLISKIDVFDYWNDLYIHILKVEDCFDFMGKSFYFRKMLYTFYIINILERCYVVLLNSFTCSFNKYLFITHKEQSTILCTGNINNKQNKEGFQEILSDLEKNKRFDWLSFQRNGNINQVSVWDLTDYIEVCTFNCLWDIA